MTWFKARTSSSPSTSMPPFRSASGTAGKSSTAISRKRKPRPAPGQLDLSPAGFEHHRPGRQLAHRLGDQARRHDGTPLLEHLDLELRSAP